MPQESDEDWELDYAIEWIRGFMLVEMSIEVSDEEVKNRLARLGLLRFLEGYEYDIDPLKVLGAENFDGQVDRLAALAPETAAAEADRSPWGPDERGIMMYALLELEQRL